MVKKIVLYCLYVSIILRVSTQMYGGDSAYFYGRDILDFFAMVGLSLFTDNKTAKIIFSFCSGLALWNLIKPWFSDPLVDDWTEFAGFYIGIVILIIQYVAKRNRT